MDYYSNQISKLIDELSRLPGIGCKVSIQTGISSDTYAERRSETSGRHYVEARENVRYCKNAAP